MDKKAPKSKKSLPDQLLFKLALPPITLIGLISYQIIPPAFVA
jgi:hypothetical protein